ITYISGYPDASTYYLRKLAHLLGLATITHHNATVTHFVCAHRAGQEYHAALAWNQHIVNHLWLEESFCSWQDCSVSRPQFTHFPPPQVLQALVGQVDLTPREVPCLQSDVLGSSVSPRCDQEANAVATPTASAALEIFEPRVFKNGPGILTNGGLDHPRPRCGPAIVQELYQMEACLRQVRPAYKHQQMSATRAELNFAGMDAIGTSASMILNNSPSTKRKRQPSTSDGS
ncbi:regulator of Ty1 Transposition, partial [Dimargaris xerosporica]